MEGTKFFCLNNYPFLLRQFGLLYFKEAAEGLEESKEDSINDQRRQKMGYLKKAS